MRPDGSLRAPGGLEAGADLSYTRKVGRYEPDDDAGLGHREQEESVGGNWVERSSRPGGGWTG